MIPLSPSLLYVSLSFYAYFFVWDLSNSSFLGCGHCKNLKPHYQDAAQVFEDEPQVTFAALDCTEHAEVCKFAGVSGYPTLKYYHYYNKGQADYNGGRTVSI